MSATRIIKGLASVGIAVRTMYTVDTTNNKWSNDDTTHPKIQRP